MADDVLRYDEMVERALRDVVRQALSDVTESGLPGAHHFYLSFRTDAPGVEMPDDLRAQHPEELTIVLQHQFWDLSVTPERFAVTLSFNQKPASLDVPFRALTSFVDPSVNFGLQFNVPEAAANDTTAAEEPAAPEAAPDGTPEGGAPDGGAPADGAGGGADVVTLDNFRKR